MSDEYTVRSRFMQEIDNYSWEGIRERVIERGSSLMECRADLLPSGRNFLIDEQALVGPALHEALAMDLISLETLGDIAGRCGLVVALERDPKTGRSCCNSDRPRRCARRGARKSARAENISDKVVRALRIVRSVSGQAIKVVACANLIGIDPRKTLGRKSLGSWSSSTFDTSGGGRLVEEHDQVPPSDKSTRRNSGYPCI